MFSLVIVIVAIALAALLALASLYYGGPVLASAGANTRATTAISQSSQVLAAAELYQVDHRAWPPSMDVLLHAEYLKSVPVLKALDGTATPWTQPQAGAPTFWTVKAMDTEACRRVNLKARGDDGVYRKARPGFVVQCFGESAPYTVVTTREGAGEYPGLEAILRFFDDRELGFDPSGGGWALEPSGGGTGQPETPVVDTGNSGGGYLGGDLQVSLPGQGGIGSNTVQVGNLGSNGKGQVVLDFTNTGSSPWTVGKVGTCGDYRVVASSCTGIVAPGQTCQVTVEAGPFPDLTEPRDLKGCVTVETDKGSARVELEGKVYPSAPGPVQVGITTNDSRDTGSLLVFPDTEVGQTSYKWMRVQNAGDTITYQTPPFTLAAPFSIAVNECQGKQAPGAYCWVRLAFTPTAAVVYPGASNPLKLQANGQALTIGLSGKGTPAPVSGVSVLPASLEWAKTFATGQETQEVTVRNNGQTVLTLPQPPVVSAGAEAFMVQSTTCGASLARNATCKVVVRFFPDKAQNYEGKLRVTITELDAQEVALAGTAVNPLVANSAVMSGLAPGAPISGAPDLASSWKLASGVALDPSRLVLSVASTLPAGLSLDPVTRQITGTPQADYGDMGVFVTIAGRYMDRFSATQTVQLAGGRAGALFKVGFSGDSLQDYLKDSVSGTVLSSSGATLVSAATPSGKALQLTTSSNVVLPSDPRLNLTGDFTVEFMARTLTKTSGGTLLGSDYFAGINNQFQLNQDAVVGRMGVYNGSWRSAVFPGVDSSQWHLYRFERRGALLHISVDDQTKTVPWAGALNLSGGRIGGLRGYAGGSFAGEMARIAIYKD